MPERNASLGYVAIKKETTAGTAVTPNVYVPYYKQSMTTAFNIVEDEPIVGSKWARYQNLRGHRTHTGSITIMAEANSIGYFMDMLCTKTATSGSNPYTHTFKDSTSTQPNSYTMDISFGSQVVRFIGVQASKVTFGFEGDLMTATFDLSALKALYGREILTISTTTINLTNDTYTASSSDGFVASDLISVVDDAGVTASLSTTVASITDGDTIVAGASAAAFAAGDMVVLRPATPSYTLLEPFLWNRTQFKFGATAAAAASATQTRLDAGTEFSIMHEFEDAGGTNRSGDFDPASLPRTTYDVNFKIKKFFDDVTDVKYWNSLTKRAVYITSVSGSTNQYELRLTINNMQPRTMDNPTESKATIFWETDYAPRYDTTDSQAFDLKVINTVSTIQG